MKAGKQWLLHSIILLCFFVLSSCTSRISPSTHDPTRTFTITTKPTSTPTSTPTPIFKATLQPFSFPYYTVNVAYIDPNNDLWVWSTDGTDTQLTASGDVRRVWMSDDGKMIAFCRGEKQNGAQSLWLINFDGSTEQLVIPEDVFGSITWEDGFTQWIVPGHLEWLGDSHKLIFNTELTPVYAHSPRDGLWSVNADSGYYQKFLPLFPGGLYFLSPDQKKVAYDRMGNIGFAFIEDNQNIEDLFSYPELRTYREGPEYAYPVWSPDSTFLTVAILTTDIEESNLQSYSINQIPINGEPVRTVATVQALFEGVFISPNGEKIAYMDGDYHESTLHILNLTNGIDCEIATGDIWFESWNIDSIGFIYNYYDHQDNRHNIYMSGIGQERLPLTSSSYIDSEWNLFWLDPEYFLYRVYNGSSWDLNITRIGSIFYLIRSMPYADEFYPPLLDYAIIDN